MRRREFIAGLGGAAAWPLAARAQQMGAPTIGFLASSSPGDAESYLAGFRRGLSESGYDEGRNITVEYRWGNNDVNLLPELAADLVRRRVAVLVAAPRRSATAAKTETTNIPIVFWAGSDAVAAGLVANLNRPGGNLTGVNSMDYELSPKRLSLLHELLPNATRFGFLVNRGVPNLKSTISGLEAAAVSIGGTLKVLRADTNREIDEAFASFTKGQVEGLVVGPSALFDNNRVQLANLALRYRVPMILPERKHAEVGGLMSYSSNQFETFRQVGTYVGRILKGEKPADLPVVQPTKFELVINLKTAKALGLTIPPNLLAVADEVIE